MAIQMKKYMEMATDTDNSNELIDAFYLNLFDNNDMILVTHYEKIRHRLYVSSNKAIHVDLKHPHEKKKINCVKNLKTYISEEIIPVSIKILERVLAASKEPENTFLLDEPRNPPKIYVPNMEITQIKENLKHQSEILELVALASEILPEIEKSLDKVVDQIIVDILFDKYCIESPKLTHSAYAKQNAKLWDANYLLFYQVDSNRKNLEYSSKKLHDLLSSQMVINQIKELGFYPEKIKNYYSKTNGKIQKIIWDILFWNTTGIIEKQFRRKITKENRNYSYSQMAKDLIDYCSMVTILLPSDNMNSKEYFNRYFDYYFLESYRRIDYILMLTQFLYTNKMNDLGSFDFLTRRFVPNIVVLCEMLGATYLYPKHKYYRPLWNLDSEILGHATPNIDTLTANRLLVYWYLCVVLRAKAYEMFLFHAEFSSDDYDEIKEFLSTQYDVCKYHRNNTAWDMLKEMIAPKPSAGAHNQVPQNAIKELRDFLRIFISVNNLFFPPRPPKPSQTQMSTTG